MVFIKKKSNKNAQKALVCFFISKKNKNTYCGICIKCLLMKQIQESIDKELYKNFDLAKAIGFEHKSKTI